MMQRRATGFRNRKLTILLILPFVLLMFSAASPFDISASLAKNSSIWAAIAEEDLQFSHSDAVLSWSSYRAVPAVLQPMQGGIDSTPKTRDVTVVIPFEFQQSSLNYPYTFKLMDSVAEILLQNDSITLSIDGYSHIEEADSNICYWLSLNRALAVKSYVLGRGVDSARLITLRALSTRRSVQRLADKEPVEYNCTAEIVLNYPIPPPVLAIQDSDEDGIPDDQDSCRNEYGEKIRNGCPNRDAIVVPFEPRQSALFANTYSILDSVISVLRKDPRLTISIEGHAYKKEGVETICEQLSRERADIVRRYLLTRQIDPSRIESVRSFGNIRPITAGRNSWEKARNSRAEIVLVHH